MLILSPVLICAGLVCWVLGHVLRCLLSPLKRLPGPWSSLFTSYVLRWHELRANRTCYIHGLHQRYGPVVRIAPNEVSFTSSEAVKEIYCSGGSGYDKTEFYHLFRAYGRRLVLTAAMRPIYCHTYTYQKGRCSPH